MFVGVFLVLSLKHLDSLFGLSLFFMVAVSPRGEAARRKPPELLKKPSYGATDSRWVFWAEELPVSDRFEPTRGGEPGCPTRGTAACWHCQELCSSGQHGLHHCSTWPDLTSSQLGRMRIWSQNLAKMKQDQGHFFKQWPGDRIETLFQLNAPLLLPTRLLLKAMPITSAGG